MTKFPIIKLKGSPQLIGTEHGTILRSQILEAIEYYLRAFDRKNSEIEEQAQHFKSQIADFNPKYCIEIEAIADAVGVDHYLIYALNARSELLNNFFNECSVFYLQQEGLLCENWDWSSLFEDLGVVLKIRQQDQVLMTITEPGIIGKIGFNSSGLGVALNYLGVDTTLSGLPIHIGLRAALECPNLDVFSTTVLPHITGTAGHILVAQKDEQYRSLEFADRLLYDIETRSSPPIHTNHYLDAMQLNDPIEDYEGSISRADQLRVMMEKYGLSSVDHAKSMLLDDTNTEFPICRRYIEHEQIEDIGTVCSVIMDLVNLEMHLTRGNPKNHEFELLKLD